MLNIRCKNFKSKEKENKLPMEELIVDVHVLVVDGAVECDGDHHGQLAQLQLAALHACQNKIVSNDDII
jgi:hypothetical protein